jgi:hypothetical protein
VSDQIPEPCARLRSVLADVVSGEATGQTVHDAESHARDCVDCHAELELARAIEGRLTILPDLEPPEQIWTKLEARLDEADRNSPGQRSKVKQPALRLVRLPARS